MASLSLASSRTRQQARDDLDRLQGVWASVAGRREVELLVAGNLFAVKFSDGHIYMGTFDLDPGESPKEMVMRIDEGPVKHKGKFTLCIYDLEGDSLRWCPTEPGSDDHLAAFPELDDPRYLCTVFHRQPPR